MRLLTRDGPQTPGDHQLQATAPGFAAATQQVRLGEGDSASVNLKLQPVSSPSRPSYCA